VHHDLDSLVNHIRAHPGLIRKGPVAEVFRELVLEGAGGTALANYGDDAAAIPQGEGFLLLACDGLPAALLAAEPLAAARASVAAAVNHIYAMGGRPLALVNLLASGDEEQRAAMVAGVKRGCAELRAPMAGGRLHPDAPAAQPGLAVAVLGQAKSLLRGHLARSGDDLIFAADLRGAPAFRSFPGWDSHAGKTSEQLLARLEVLPAIAERGLALAAKDVGLPGVIGTAAILAENAGLGALIELRDIPCPDQADPLAWLLSNLSYGFVLAAPPVNSPEILGMFRERGLAAEVVGRITAEPLVVLESGPERQVLFDLEHEAITGIRFSG
jgi:selenophosphate synthetase-related protein